MAETETNEAGQAAALAANLAAKTRGQEILERMLGQFNRLLRVRQQLERVRDQIEPRDAPRAPVAAAVLPTGGQAQTFFGALDLLCDGNDGILDELERSIAEVGDLF